MDKYNIKELEEKIIDRIKERKNNGKSKNMRK